VLMLIGVWGMFIEVIGGVFAWDELLGMQVLEACVWGLWEEGAVGASV